MALKNHITGLILAGGAGQRAGGRDKGLIEWHGKPMIAHVRDRLAPQVSNIVISCNRNATTYRDYADFIVIDSRAGFQGPLAGLEAAQQSIDSKIFIVTTCDTPCLPLDLVSRLVEPLQQLGNSNLDVCFAHDGQREQYLCAAIRRQCLPSLTQFLDRGDRAVRQWYSDRGATSVDFSDQHRAFSNYNVVPVQTQKHGE